MAGSYRHITDSKNNIISNEEFPKMIENLGDAYEALEECYYMIGILTNWDLNKINEVHTEYLKMKGANVNNKNHLFHRPYENE